MTTKLSCIMFTDIFGFSQMMESSESRTLKILDHHNTLVFPIIESFSGSIVDTVGDGLLVIFDSALAAVNCAVAIQQSVHTATYQQPIDLQFKMRIGLHLGDIWYDKNRVYGNGVNIASRIEAQALPGGICISEDMYNQVANKLTLEFQSLGVVPLKNIERPIRLYSIVTGFEATEPEPQLVAKEDERRQQLLEAREKIRTELELFRRRPNSAGSAIEERVLSFVDKVMDKALTKWESLPPEKKQELYMVVDSSDAQDLGKELGNEIDKELSKDLDQHRGQRNPKKIVSIQTGGSRKKNRNRKIKPKGLGDLVPLGLFIGAFGTGIFHFGIGWMWVPFVLFGIGFMSELGSVITSRISYKNQLAELPKIHRQQLLDAAASITGKITAVKIATKTKLDLDEVQGMLDDLTAKGYICQHLDSSGGIYYEFLE